ALPRLDAERLRQDRRRAVLAARDRRRAGLRAAEVERDHEEARSAEVQHAHDAEPSGEGRRPLRAGARERREAPPAEMTARWLFAALAIVAMPLRATLFTGNVDGKLISIELPEDASGEIAGFSLRPSPGALSFFRPSLDVRLLTGTRTGDRVTLREWGGRDRQTGAIAGEILHRTDQGQRYEGVLRGTWTTGGRSVRIEMLYDSTTRDRDYQSGAVMQRLHDAVRDRRWADAQYEAKLACAVNETECGWLRALPALEAGRMPAAEPYEPWKMVALERAGRWNDA